MFTIKFNGTITLARHIGRVIGINFQRHFIRKLPTAFDKAVDQCYAGQILAIKLEDAIFPPIRPTFIRSNFAVRFLDYVFGFR